MKLLAGTVTIDDVEQTIARLGEIADRHDTTVQGFDGRYIAGRTHMERAVEFADRAIDRGTTIARDRGVEILLYAAGRRQIDQALEMGLASGTGPVVILVNGGDEAAAAGEIAESLDGDLERVDSPPSGDPETIRSFFDITGDESEATNASLEDLVCERVALLIVDR